MSTSYLISDKYELTIKADVLSLLLLTLALLLIIAFWKFVPAKLG